MTETTVEIITKTEIETEMIIEAEIKMKLGKEIRINKAVIMIRVGLITEITITIIVVETTSISHGIGQTKTIKKKTQ